MYHIDNLRVATLSLGVKGHTASLPNWLKAAVFFFTRSWISAQQASGSGGHWTVTNVDIWVEQEVTCFL